MKQIDEKTKAELNQIISEVRRAMNLANPCVSGTPEAGEWLTWATRGFMLKGQGPGDEDIPAAHEGWQHGCESRQSVGVID